MIDDIMQQLLCSVPGLNVKTNEPMSRHTTFRIGGPADLWCRPNTIDELIETVQFATNKGIPFQIIGMGPIFWSETAVFVASLSKRLLLTELQTATIM